MTRPTTELLPSIDEHALASVTGGDDDGASSSTSSGGGLLDKLKSWRDQMGRGILNTMGRGYF
jgi:hypothetical protein